LPVPFSVSTAFVPLSSAMVKYGLFTCFGRKAIFSPRFSGAFGSAGPALGLVPPAAARAPASRWTSPFVVPPPQAATTPASNTTAARTLILFRIENS
jgi:hypothetical protein